MEGLHLKISGSFKVDEIQSVLKSFSCSDFNLFLLLKFSDESFKQLDFHDLFLCLCVDFCVKSPIQLMEESILSIDVSKTLPTSYNLSKKSSFSHFLHLLV